MLEKNYETAKEFWTTQAKYPAYDHVEARRLCDVKYIAPRIQSARSVVDLGCGDGKISLILSNLTKVNKFTLVDYSTAITDIQTLASLTLAKFNFSCIDLSKKNAPIPASDAVICLGLFPYIFDDEHLSSLIGSLKTSKLIVRTPCTLYETNDVINTQSKALGAQYSAVYRTLKNTIAIIEPHFRITEVDRIYPDEIESKFRTKQFILNCEEPTL